MKRLYDLIDWIPNSPFSLIQRGRGATIAILFCLLHCGCQFAPTKSPKLWPWKKDAPPEMPERVLAVWSDSVLHQPGQPGVRGFGGRIYFYQSSGSDPVKVDGGLAVYVFDADELDPYNQKPLRKFMFTADQFEEHLSSTALGPSYSVWLPFDEVGGEARRLSLISRFEGREGGTVISEPTVKLLPGMPKLAKKDNGSGSTEASGQVRMVGHQTRSSEQVVSNEALGGRAIQTIDLPPNFNRRLVTAGSANSGAAADINFSNGSWDAASFSSAGGLPVGDLLTAPGPDELKRTEDKNQQSSTDFEFIRPPALGLGSQDARPLDNNQAKHENRPLKASSNSRGLSRDSRPTGFINPPR
jgi:hypothetical protein